MTDQAISTSRVTQEEAHPETVVATGKSTGGATNTATNLVRKTHDYSIFKLLPGNRPIDERHVLYLIERMDEHDFSADRPMDVNKELGIIDGQHRLEAWSRTGRPAYYKFSSAMTPEDIAAVNSSSKNWKLGDYLTYHIAKGNKEYVALKEFAEKWQILPYNAIGLLAGNSAQPGSGDVKAFERGDFVIKNLAHAEKVMEHIQEFAEFIPHIARGKAFMNSIVRLLRLPSYDSAEMVKKSRTQADQFTTKYNDVMSYLSLLERLYNHRRPSGQAVNFRVA